ncbi:MAG: hypothetical protein ACRDL3_16245 [Solirubrobacterales bacterium]
MAGVKYVAGACAAGALLAVAAVPAAGQHGPTASSQLLKQDVLVAADMWKQRPRMLGEGSGSPR